MAERFELKSTMPVSADALWAWHERPGAFERLSPPWEQARLLHRDEGLQVGAKTVIEMKVGPVPTKWVAEHVAYEPGVMFRDVQREGPFAKWVHTHRFEKSGDGQSVMHDEVEYELPLGALGQAFGGTSARGTLERLFRYRHALLKADLQRHAQFKHAPRRTVAITGASGLIGQALAAFLSTGGHTVKRVKRGDFDALEGVDAIVHLAGAPISQRWSSEHRGEIVDSRVQYTHGLVEHLQRAHLKPEVLISGSAIGVYGDRGDETLTETSAPGPRGELGAKFLSGLCLDWEAEGLRARELGTRVVLLRTGIVLSANGGALQAMLTPFRAGVGGPIGSGKQWFSWVSLEDQIGAIHHALMTKLEGPVNVTAPTPVTNADFARELGRVLSRPSFAKTPAFALKAVFGEMAEGAILASQRVLPAALQAAGFQFLHPSVGPALAFTLGQGA